MEGIRYTMFLTAPNLEGIAHGFFTRQGGVSEGLYASLNCGQGSGDIPERVAENRARVAQALGAKASNLISLYQIHGKEVLTVEKPWSLENKPKADAMVTRVSGIAIGIMTADCVPVLFADRQVGVIGAAHAGWKGALAGVLEATIEVMERLGAVRSDINAAIGPAIAQGSYEVGENVRLDFMRKDAELARFFRPSGREGHLLFDLQGLVRDDLVRLGLSSIHMFPVDTYADEARFFSFRRTTHRKESDYGRQISAIMLS